MKCALVTGGSRGIGRAICIKLGSLGYHVLINFLSNSAEADKTLSLIRHIKGTGELLPFDVSNKHDISETLGLWTEAHKEDHIEVLVNNAGIKEDVLMMWMKDIQWENVIRTNLDSFFYITRHVLNDMTENISEKEMKSIIPVNRFGSVEEVAHLVAFLVSSESGYITGEVISINGGLYT